MLIPRRELEFQVHKVLNAPGLCNTEHFGMHDRAVLDGVIDSAYRIAAERFLPFAARTDIDEPRFDGSSVEMIPETRTALTALSEAGFFAAPFDAGHGGLQLPQTVTQACSAVFASAHVGFHAYAMLTAGAANLILHFGTSEQRHTYALPMLEGRFFGTMCLSETQAGSSLTDLQSRAIRQPDGSYRLTGSKMWISGGDHDLAENIVHLVLAKVPGGPPGVKGLSLFIVPRHHVDADGRPAARNDVRLAGINHKMGWRGTVNTVLSFGERGECIAHLVGREHHGLGYMFQMMNEARIGVGMCAVGLGYAGYLNALAYARERPQGRPLEDKDPASVPVPIIRHPDVRRMLLAQKAWVEGGLALVLYCARLVDDLAVAETGREAITDLLELLTPVAKSWPSEFCLEANKFAIQVLGGYGYTRDYPVERLYRDNRLNHIHEGTYGIHGLDLLGRKVGLRGGAGFTELGRRIRDTIEQARSASGLEQEAAALEMAWRDVEVTTRGVAAAGATVSPAVALANATVYLEAIGHVIVAWRWLAMAYAAAQAMRGADVADSSFYQGKLDACRFFFRYELPRTGPQLALVRSLDRTTIDFADGCW